MEKEKYLGNALLKEQPKKKLNFKIRDGSITIDKLDSNLRTTIQEGSEVNQISNTEIDRLWVYDSTLGKQEMSNR